MRLDGLVREQRARLEHALGQEGAVGDARAHTRKLRAALAGVEHRAADDDAHEHDDERAHEPRERERSARRRWSGGVMLFATASSMRSLRTRWMSSPFRSSR